MHLIQSFRLYLIVDAESKAVSKSYIWSETSVASLWICSLHIPVNIMVTGDYRYAFRPTADSPTKRLCHGTNESRSLIKFRRKRHLG